LTGQDVSGENTKGYDYVIVGAGAAGCVLASRLSEDPSVKVALVESGPDRNSKKPLVKMPLAMVTFMAPALAFLGGAKFMSWFETEPEPGLQGRRIALPRGKGTGGSTNVNGQCFIRGQREDFDQWRELGNKGWGYDDLLPYFRKLERFDLVADPQSAAHIKLNGKPIAEQIDAKYHGGDGPLDVAQLRSVNPMCEVYLKAAQLAGHELTADFNGERQAGVGYYTFTQRNGERLTAEGAYLDPVRARPNLTIISNKHVTGVQMDGKRAVGVRWRDETGGTGETKGAEIILSAGSFASPHLLLLSGIGNGRDLERLGIDVVHDLPGVGKNLQDHLDVTLEYKAKTTAPYGISWKALPRNVIHVLDWIFRRRGVFASTTGEGGGFLSSVKGETRPDFQLFFCTAVANTQNAAGFTGHGFLMHICQLRPGSIGKLSLKSADPFEKPSILYNFFRGQSTMDVLREGIRMARQIIAQKPFEPHVDREVDPGPDVTSDGAIEAFIRQSVGTLFHPVGTCAMGTGPDAVVDPATLRVHGLAGLRVVDASVMPTIVSANTVAATYCLAEKGADLIKAEAAANI
jgi:choline dehydrogenase-like flavoprotein